MNSGKEQKVVSDKKQKRVMHLLTDYRSLFLYTYHLPLTAFFFFILTAYRLPLSYAAFEQSGAGARPIGMGSAFTAISDDAHAIYYNPSGLAQIRRGELTAGYGRIYVGLKDRSNLGTGFVGVAQSLKQGKLGTMGVGWTSLSLEGAYREDEVSLAYGKEVIWDGVFVGGSAKILKRSFASDLYTEIDPLFINKGNKTSNISFDLGMIYRPTANYSFGFVMKNVNQPDIGLGGQERVPLEIRGGFGYHQRQLVFDGEISRKDKDVTVAMGLEKYLYKMVGFRAGFNVGSRNKREIATGLSYKGPHIGVDYAFVFPLSGVESTSGNHRFGVVIRFGKEPEKARWEFETEEKVMERLLEEKAVQISAMEQELDNLRDQNRSGRLESKWVREQIQKLEQKLKVQETKDLETMKRRMFESKIEEEKMKKKIQEMEERIKRLVVPKKAPVAPKEEAVPAAPSAPAVPRTYLVQEGETLQTIAEKFYGDSAKWVEIYELNSDRIERGGTIRTGQMLLLPEK